MTGRLASAFVAEPGKPQKIYTVPAEKVVDGEIVVLNTIGTSAKIQVKHGQAIEAPAASFPLSNAEQIADSGAVRPGVVMFDLGGNVVVSANGSNTPRSIDLTNQLVPVADVTPATGMPRTPAAWAVSDRLCMPASNYSAELRRYSGSVTPWSPGTFGTVTGGDSPMSGVRTVVGWDQYAVGFNGTINNVSFVTTAPTSGSQTWIKATFADLGITAAAHASYWSESYVAAHVANGVFFLSYPSSSGYQYRRIVSLLASDVGPLAQWNEFSGNFQTQSNGIYNIFHANGAYYFFTQGNNGSGRCKIYKLPEGDLATTTSISGMEITDGPINYNTYGNGLQRDSLMQLADGKIVWTTGNTPYVLDPTTDIVSNVVAGVGDLSVSANYTAYHSGKLTPVNIGTVYHSVPRDGAADPANDRITYTSNGIYKFVTDDTWALDHVTDAAGWIDYDLILADKAEVEYSRQMFNATDEIWIRSTEANLTVTVKGFVLDV